MIMNNYIINVNSNLILISNTIISKITYALVGTVYL